MTITDAIQREMTSRYIPQHEIELLLWTARLFGDDRAVAVIRGKRRP